MISIGALNSLFIGKATWTVDHSESDQTVLVGFQCERRTPVFRISDRAIRDVFDPTLLVASKCVDLYTNHHRIVQPFEAQPTLTCGHCRAAVDVPSTADLADHEFCERQAVLWMERAAATRRVL